ncbi:hypothetical protein [Bradyrhizobium sp. F1.13.3]|uniref:hypothetical protein n=1 Tax=Bradyrhizobium sp. F1.13.3 TaxID=3156351 RepID=UPI0033915F45
MTRTELEKAFGDLIVEARRADLGPVERGQFVDVLEREIRMILRPLHDDGDAWADIGGARRAR